MMLTRRLVSAGLMGQSLPKVPEKAASYPLPTGALKGPGEVPGLKAGQPGFSSCLSFESCVTLAKFLNLSELQL